MSPKNKTTPRRPAPRALDAARLATVVGGVQHEGEPVEGVVGRRPANGWATFPSW